MTDERRMSIRFGGLSPSLRTQLADQGLTADLKDLTAIQRDADAVARLSIRGVLTDAQKQACHRKLMKQLTAIVGRASL